MGEPARAPQRDIDWDEVRKRLDRLAAEMEERLSLSPEQAEKVLDARARAIGQAPIEADDTTARIEILTLSLANERFGMETRYVREVVPLPSVTPVPGTPGYISGVANLRGEIIAIVDLGRFFGLKTESRTDPSRIVVLGAERAELGILADEVSEVASLPIDGLADLRATTTRIDGSYLRGVTTDALIVLDIPVLLNAPSLFIDHGRASDAAALEKRE